MSAPTQPPQSHKLPEANEAGQKPPSDENATRQRYQMGTESAGIAGRQRTRSSLYNRGSQRPRGY